MESLTPILRSFVLFEEVENRPFEGNDVLALVKMM